MTEKLLESLNRSFEISRKVNLLGLLLLLSLMASAEPVADAFLEKVPRRHRIDNRSRAVEALSDGTNMLITFACRFAEDGKPRPEQYETKEDSAADEEAYARWLPLDDTQEGLLLALADSVETQLKNTRGLRALKVVRDDWIGRPLPRYVADSISLRGYRSIAVLYMYSRFAEPDTVFLFREPLTPAELLTLVAVFPVRSFTESQKRVLDDAFRARESWSYGLDLIDDPEQPIGHLRATLDSLKRGLDTAMASDSVQTGSVALPMVDLSIQVENILIIAPILMFLIHLHNLITCAHAARQAQRYQDCKPDHWGPQSAPVFALVSPWMPAILQNFWPRCGAVVVLALPLLVILLSTCGVFLVDYSVAWKSVLLFLSLVSVIASAVTFRFTKWSLLLGCRELGAEPGLDSVFHPSGKPRTRSSRRRSVTSEHHP